MRYVIVVLVIAVITGCSDDVGQPPARFDTTAHSEAAMDSFLRKMLNSDRRPTGFTESARWGRVDLLRDAISAGHEINTPDENGSTALILASSGGQLEAMSFLLENGADVNTVGHVGITPLIALLAALHAEDVYCQGAELLIAAGADPTIRDSSGRAPLDWVTHREETGAAERGRLREIISQRNAQ